MRDTKPSNCPNTSIKSCSRGARVSRRFQVAPSSVVPSSLASSGPMSCTVSTLEANQGQIDGFFGQLPCKCHQNRVAPVGDGLKIWPWVTFRVVLDPPEVHLGEGCGCKGGCSEHQGGARSTKGVLGAPRGCLDQWSSCFQDCRLQCPVPASAQCVGQHIFRDVQRAVLALVVRQQNTNLSAGTASSRGIRPTVQTRPSHSVLGSGRGFRV